MVIDSGAIAPEVRNKIMAPFFTTKPPGEGTGLGLSIARSIMHDHGGELHLDTDSKHTTFTVEIPVYRNSEKKAA